MALIGFRTGHVTSSFDVIVGGSLVLWTKLRVDCSQRVLWSFSSLLPVASKLKVPDSCISSLRPLNASSLQKSTGYGHLKSDSTAPEQQPVVSTFSFPHKPLQERSAVMGSVRGLNEWKRTLARSLKRRQHSGHLHPKFGNDSVLDLRGFLDLSALDNPGMKGQDEQYLIPEEKLWAGPNNKTSSVTCHPSRRATATAFKKSENVFANIFFIKKKLFPRYPIVQAAFLKRRIQAFG